MSNKETRFQKGQSGNPKGRPRGSRNKSTMTAQMLLEGEAEALTRKCIDMALGGDTVALKLCLSRLVPMKRDRTIDLELPPVKNGREVLEAMGTVVAAVGEGRITPAEGQSVAALLEAHRRAFEVEDLELRLNALEELICAGT